MALRKLNDRICKEHGYSVIENPKEKSQSYTEKAAVKRGRSFKEQLRQTIDNVILKSSDFEEFLSHMRAEGYEIKRRGKSLEFRAEGQIRFTRSFRLGNDYTESALHERITGVYKNRSKLKPQKERKNINLLIDIQAKMQQGKGKGYEKWAQVFNLKETAKTLNFLVEHNIEDYSVLEEMTENLDTEFQNMLADIKRLEGRMADIAKLKMHIINYSKTRDIYVKYKKSRNKKAFKEEHRGELEKHKAAKAAFDALGGKPIPKVAQLSQDYKVLAEEKKKLYERYRSKKKYMIEYKKAKQNIDKILGLPSEDKQKKRLEAER